MKTHFSPITELTVGKILSRLLGLTLFSFALLVADPARGAEFPEKYSKVKIAISTEADIRTVQRAHLELGRVYYSDGYVESILDTREIEALDKTGLSYEIIIDDMVAHYHENVRLPDAEMGQLEREMKALYNIIGFEFGSMGGYYTFDEVVIELDSMRLLYPNLISARQSIGVSIDTLDLWMVKISDNPDIDEDEPEVLYTALHHPREPQSMATVMYFMYYLLENYGTDPFVTFIVDNRELYFVPVLNPDGYVYNEQTHPNGGGMLRKNKRDNNENGIFEESYDGVGLNANYEYQWGYDDLGSSPYPSSGNYRGAGPFSEPETQAIRDFCITRNFQLAFNYHTPWRHLFVPWGYIYNDLTPDSAIFVSLAENITQYNQYSWSASTKSLAIAGVVNGYSDDWMYGEQTLKNKIFAMTLEVGTSNSTLEFWPSQNKIYPFAQENVYPNLILALGPGVIDTESTLHAQNASINASYLAPGLDTLFIAAEIINPNSDSVAVLTIIESMDHSSLDTIPMLDDGNHRDSTAGDGIYGSYWPVRIDEKHYTLHVYLRSEEFGIDHFSNDVARFTTVGPVEYTADSSIAAGTAPNVYHKIYLTLRNAGSMATATGIEARLSALDTCVTTIHNSLAMFGDILAGEAVMGSGFYPVTFNPNCPAGTEVPFALSISSDGYEFWSDTFDITITDPEVGIAQVDDALPTAYALHPAYPNPFNPVTTLRYDLPRQAEVSLAIYDILGREVRTLVAGTQAPGYKTVTWDGNDARGRPVSSGVYLYRIQAGEFATTKKMLLLK